MDKEYINVSGKNKGFNIKQNRDEEIYAYEYTTNFNKKFYLWSIAPVESSEGKFRLCTSNDTPISCRFIFFPEQIAKNFLKKGISVEYYINNDYISGELSKCKTILDNTFQYIANTARALEKSPELDLGLDEALIYAYIMTHNNIFNIFIITIFLTLIYTLSQSKVVFKV